MNILLKAKHWHLFFLVSGLLICFQPLMLTVYIYTPMEVYYAPVLIIWAKYSIILLLVSLIVFFGWIWSMVDILSKISEINKINTRRFKIIFVILFGCILILFSAFVGFIISFLEDYSYIIQFGIPEIYGPSVAFTTLFIFPFALFSPFGLIYVINFTSKTLKTIIHEHNPQKKNFTTLFFLILLFPIGIWFIQPEINKIVNKST